MSYDRKAPVPADPHTLSTPSDPGQTCPARFTARQLQRQKDFKPDPTEHRLAVADPGQEADGVAASRANMVRQRSFMVAGGYIERENRAEHLARAQAEMDRARSVAEPESHPDAKDLRLRSRDAGPAHQRRTRRIEVVDAVDPSQPDGPRIRRARLRDPLRRMVRAGHLPYRLYYAAEEFREDLERAEGGQDPDEALARALRRAEEGAPPPASAPWLRSNHAAPGQFSAVVRIKRAWRDAVGQVAAGVFHWVVISRGTLDDYSTCKGVRRADAAATLKAALSRLADTYNVGDVQPPPGWERG